MRRATHGAALALLAGLGSGACLPERAFWIEPDTAALEPAQRPPERSLALVVELTQGGAAHIRFTEPYVDRVLERLRHSGEFSSVRWGSVPADARLEFLMDFNPPVRTPGAQLLRWAARLTFGWVADAQDTRYAISLRYLDRSGRQVQQQSSRALLERAGRLPPRAPIARRFASAGEAFTQLLEQAVDEFVMRLRHEGAL